MQANGKFRANPNLLLRQIAGESLLIPVGEMATKTHGIICLSESGVLLWKQMQQPCTQEDLVECMLREYDVDRETARQDVTAFLEKMDAVGILESFGEEATA